MLATIEQTTALDSGPTARGLALLKRGGTAASGLASGTLPVLVLAWTAGGIIIFAALFSVWMTFVPRLPINPGFTFDNYTRVFDRYLLEVIPNTVLLGLGVVAFTVFWGVSLAWLLNRTNVPYRSLWITLLSIVLLVPGFLKAMGWILLLNPKIGVINSVVASVIGVDEVGLSVKNIWGIIFVMGLSLTPIVFFLVSGPIRSLDPALEEAAHVSGVSTRKTILRISLPMLWPAILGGAIYVFMTAVAIFEIPAVLGGLGRVSVLATELFYNVRPPEGAVSIPRYGVAGVYGLFIAVPSIIALIFYLRMIDKSHRYAVIGGKGYRPGTIDLGRARYLALAFVVLYLLLSAILPLAVLLWISLLPRLMLPSMEALSLLTFDNFARMGTIIGGTGIVVNTVILTVAAPIIAMFFGLMMSWVVVRSKTRGHRVLDIVAMLPHAIPGLVFGFAFFMLAIVLAKFVPWLPFFQTIGLVVVVVAVNRISYSTRLTNAALLQVARELEESAHVSGSGTFATLRLVLAPLIRTSLLFGLLWTALLAFREVSIPLLLAGANNKVLAVSLWNEWQLGRLNEASALAVIMILVMSVVILIFQRFGGLKQDRGA